MANLPAEQTLNAALYAIIVTYNAEQWVAAALESLLGSTLQLRIVVVDNASTDRTVEIVRSTHAQAAVIQMPFNSGFAAANNEGIKHALSLGADYIFLLNQDAKVTPDTAAHLVALLRRHPDFGILSPLHLEYQGKEVDAKFLPYLQSNAALVSDALLGTLQAVYEVSFVNAAAWLMRRSLLETAGGFDPVFFMYGEDNDYCTRARHHGFKVGIAPHAHICHWHGGAGAQDMTMKRMTHMLRTQAINLLKRPDRTFARNVPGFCIAWLSKCLHAIIEGDARQCAAVIASFLNVIPDLPRIKAHQALCRQPGSVWL